MVGQDQNKDRNGNGGNGKAEFDITCFDDDDHELYGEA